MANLNKLSEILVPWICNVPHDFSNAKKYFALWISIKSQNNNSLTFLRQKLITYPAYPWRRVIYRGNGDLSWYNVIHRRSGYMPWSDVIYCLYGDLSCSSVIHHFSGYLPWCDVIYCLYGDLSCSSVIHRFRKYLSWCDVIYCLCDVHLGYAMYPMSFLTLNKPKF